MAKQFIDLTMRIYADPSHTSHEDGGTGDSISNLTEALQMVADCWPGVEVVDPCLFERKDGEDAMPSDAVLQKRNILRDSSDRYLDLVVDGIIAHLGWPESVAKIKRKNLARVVSSAMTAATAGKVAEPTTTTKLS